MDLLLFGIQGSGKGTQARKLAEDHGYALFEAGAQLRAIAATDSDLGKLVKSYIDAGNLVPAEVIIEVARAFVGEKSPDTKILFDGVPRTEEQRIAFDTLMQESGREFVGIHFLLDKDEALERVLGRAKLEGRVDDASEEAIRRRMNLFEEMTVPVINVYREQGKIRDIDAAGGVEEVYEKLTQVIEEPVGTIN